MRIGVPVVGYSLDQYQFKMLSPTTGGISFNEKWSKTRQPYVILSFTVIGQAKLLSELETGKEYSLKIIMPPWSDGSQEIRRVSRAYLVETIHKVCQNKAEIVDYIFEFNKINMIIYDHDCEDVHVPFEDCRGSSRCNKWITVDPDTGPSFKLYNEGQENSCTHTK